MSGRNLVEQTLYEEEQPTQRWVLVSAWLATCAAGAIIIAACFVPGIPLFLILPASGVLLFALFSVMNFSRLRIRVTAERITFGFGVFRWHVRWRDVVRVSTRPYIFLRFLGWGIRLDWRGTIGFIARSSMGVQLETPHIKYFVSTNHPQEICELAQRYMVSGKQKV